jgi:beta-hydroxylase
VSAEAHVIAPRRSQVLKITTRLAKRIVPLALAVYFFPKWLAFYVGCGLLDVLRNQHRTPATIDRYFAGNGFFTWLLSPFNLLLDLLSLPYRNRGIYKLADLPAPYQKEIAAVIETAHRRNLIGELEAKLGEKKRGMIFFKWYGKDLPTSVDVPEYHQPYRYIRTIGVSIFNKKQSTGKHFGPLRVTLRVLYNIHPIANRNIYIRVGNHTHYWQDDQLFIFDDTLQHQSCNESDAIRYCLFVDILRPALFPQIHSAILAGIRLFLTRFNHVFFKHWTFIR